MQKVYGSLDSAANSCVLLYDFFGNSYEGEPTVNLFTQPTGNAGFIIKPADTGRHFYKLDYYNNNFGQGTFFDNATGDYKTTDSVYKYNYVSGQTDSISNRHGFSIKITRGETYSYSTDVYVATGHPRTGVAPVVSLTPNLTGSFATVTGYYDFNKKGTWQTISDKVYVPAVTNNFGGNAIFYEVSVAAKTSQHPYYATGSSDGFLIGNVQGRAVNLYKGATYVFLQSNSSNINDEFYLSTTANSGGGSNAYSNGFSYYGNEGFDGYAIFTVPYDSPSVLHYNSRRVSSSYFGGKINILGGYNAGNTGNSGNVGSSGTSGSSGSSGATTSSESYAVCFDPTRSQLTPSNLNGGYILYKNMQFEKNKKMFAGVVHPTQFTSSSRSAFGSFIDITGGNNNSNLANAMFDSNAYILFGNRTNSNEGGIVDINLKYNKTKTFSIGSAAAQTYDFWFKQNSASFEKAYLFSRSSSVNGDYFVENEGYPQLIFIQDGRVYFRFASPNSEILSGFTGQLINVGNLYNVIVTVNTYLAVGSKVNIYVNGQEAAVTILSTLEPPSNLNFSTQKLYSGNVGNIGNLGVGANNTSFYCVSSFDANGESKASNPIAAVNDPVNKGVNLSWPVVNNAFGYYVYRSASPVFGNYSLLTTINNKAVLNFLDTNLSTQAGFPKATAKYNYKYSENVSLLVDNAAAKVCFGSYPIASLVPNYFEGYIYRAAIYNTKLNSVQANRNYNSFLYKYISQDPDTIYSYKKQRSVITGNTGTTGSAGSFRKVLE